MENSLKLQKKEKTIWIDSNQITFKATGDETRGAYSLIEMTVEPASQVPLHMHTKEDEGLYVIDGDLSVRYGQYTNIISGGSSLFLPRGIPHSYKNIGQKQCKILLFYTPSGFENFLEEIGNENMANNKEEKGYDDILKIAKTYGIEIINDGE